MTVYQYTAKDEQGSIYHATHDGIASVAALRTELTKMGETLINAKKIKADKSKFAKINQADIVAFVYKLAGMSSAGLSIITSLESLEQQTENNSLQQVISNIRQSIQTGSSLRDAFGKYEDIFSVFFIGMLEAGESSGKLSETLTISAVYLEKQLELKRKIKSAFAYPIIVGVMCIIIVIVMMIFVVPVFSNVYRQLHVSLPGPTKCLVVLSVSIKKFWWLILPIAVGFVFLLRKLAKKKQIKIKLDSYKLKLPIFGKLLKSILISRFIRTLSILIASGVSLIKSLQIASLVANNSKLAQITEDIQNCVEAGNPIADAFKKHDIFPSIIIQLADSGEQAGSLSEMLGKGVDFLDKDIERAINSLLVKLEPIMTLIMGLIVGFILLGVYLPMFDYMSHVK
ncbi:MAG: type II secretion system F family protein [Phycisphaerae bacterium]|nr:type II secretion system F family protein [Phycisphaerae bacterium]